MAPNRGRSRAKDFDDVLQPGVQDFDPEADDLPQDPSDSDGSFEDEIEGDGAREHYVEVGKSKLRQPKTAILGPQYRGSKISRDAVGEHEEEEDDPFGRGYQDEEDRTSDEDGEASQGEDESAEETSDTDLSDGETRKTARPAPREMDTSKRRYEDLRSMMNESKDVTARLALSNKADVEKGKAVKKQRAAFDSLLGTRIKLQKALIGANSAVGISSGTLENGTEDTIARAEAAAFQLWSSLTDLRDEMIGSRTGEKRKRSHITKDTPVEALWTHMREQEQLSTSHRNATLKRWTEKTRSGSATLQSGVLNQNGRQSTVIDSIQEYLSNSERLVKRAHTPRSCAPLQVARNITEDESIYDDADFYGLLLKELLEQKSQDSVAASNVDLSFSLRREAKTRKNVDTKASKGRKLRYTVHEKLQNFMAPEDRRRWGDRQADELFRSLFGQNLGLGEEEEPEEEMDDVADLEDDGLMLFRN